MEQSKNQHIREFLSYYCTLESPPEYAVLISGLWGSGKTWFVQNVFAELNKSGLEYLYVSLNGIRSTEEIENEFFRQLHPILTSNGIRLIGKLSKGIIKTAFSLDVDDDGEIKKLFSSIKTAENKILVFDDIERCSVPLGDLLGYINQFVEHGSFKSILIANEEEILKQEDAESKVQAYERIKEKLIGRTFELQPEPIPALNHFISQLQSEQTKTVATDNISLIAQIYESSMYRNLRLLKHGLSDFDRLFSMLPEDIRNNKPLISNLLALFLVYAFEIRSGNIAPSELKKITSSWLSDIGLKAGQPNPNQKFKDIIKKYTEVDLHDSLFNESIWEQIFCSGLFPLAEINEALLKSKYFMSSTQPDWVRLWHYFDLSDSDFEALLKAVEGEWKSKSYNDLGVIQHVAGTLLALSEGGLYGENVSQIIEIGKEHIDDLKAKNLLPPSPRGAQLFDVRGGFGGLGFHSAEMPAFLEFREYIAKQMQAVLIESYKTEAKTLLQMLSDDPDKFRRSLIISNHEDNRFFDTPILVEIPPSQFVNAILHLPPANRSAISIMFKGRYEFENFNMKLITELDWLKQVIVLLDEEIKKLAGKLSGYTIGIYIRTPIEEAIKKLELLVFT